MAAAVLGLPFLLRKIGRCLSVEEFDRTIPQLSQQISRAAATVQQSLVCPVDLAILTANRLFLFRLLDTGVLSRRVHHIEPRTCVKRFQIRALILERSVDVVCWEKFNVSHLTVLLLCRLAQTAGIWPPTLQGIFFTNTTAFEQFQWRDT